MEGERLEIASTSSLIVRSGDGFVTPGVSNEAKNTRSTRPEWMTSNERDRMLTKGARSTRERTSKSTLMYSTGDCVLKVLSRPPNVGHQPRAEPGGCMAWLCAIAWAKAAGVRIRHSLSWNQTE